MAGSILALNFMGALPTITFQYHPAAISQTIQSNSQSVAGLDSTITYVTSKNNWENSINITAYFTTIVPNRDDLDKIARAMNWKDRLIGTAGTIIAASTHMGGRGAITVLESGLNVVSLARGIIDLAAGTITGNTITALPVGQPRALFERLRVLTNALKESVPCTINWDVDNVINDENKYLIQQISVNTEGIDEKYGNSLVARIDLHLIKYGVRVEVL